MNKSYQPWTLDQAFLLPPSLRDWLEFYGAPAPPTVGGHDAGIGVGGQAGDEVAAVSVNTVRELVRVAAMEYWWWGSGSTGSEDESRGQKPRIACDHRVEEPREARRIADGGSARRAPIRAQSARVLVHRTEPRRNRHKTGRKRRRGCHDAREQQSCAGARHRRARHNRNSTTPEYHCGYERPSTNRR